MEVDDEAEDILRWFAFRFPPERMLASLCDKLGSIGDRGLHKGLLRPVCVASDMQQLQTIEGDKVVLRESQQRGNMPYISRGL